MTNPSECRLSHRKNNLDGEYDDDDGKQEDELSNFQLVATAIDFGSSKWARNKSNNVITDGPLVGSVSH